MSQRTLETEYYLVDIPMILRFKTHDLAEERLYTLQSMTVAQTTDKDVYQRYVDELKAGLYVTDTSTKEAERLDRNGLAQLRNKLNGRR